MNYQPIIDNYHLIVSIALKFSTYKKRYDTEDLIQVGAIGLMKALDKYDPSKAKFSTFATWCVRNSILSFLQKESRLDREISYPNKKTAYEFEYDSTSIPKLSKIENAIVELKKKKYNNIEISKIMNLSYSKVITIVKSIKKKINDEKEKSLISN